MIIVHLSRLLIVIISLVTCSISDEYANEETRRTFVSEFVEPLVISNGMNERQRRSTSIENSNEIMLIKIGNWTIESVKNDRLVVSPKLEIHWIDSGISSIRNISSYGHNSECDTRHGHIVDDESSIVVLTICYDDFYVMINVDDKIFNVRPIDNGRHILEGTINKDTKNSKKKFKNNDEMMMTLEKERDFFFEISSQKEDLLDESDFDKFDGAKIDEIREKRAVGKCRNRSFYNLTGDTFEIEDENEGINVKDEAEKNNEKQKSEIEKDDESDVGKDEENVGYFFDRTWERTKLPKRKIIGKDLPLRWLELGIAIDYSVIDFHGHRVQQYVLALLNIVSAIYKDPSLDSNLRLVIVRMIFYSEKSDGMVRHGNARKSLENVNKWNRKLLSSADENHDVAVWLTRLDIGGPSGYAPVSGACDPARSCALNRDEGLTSAFIIAHEVAHILGLTHDGDETAGNNCGEEASMGSVMAPMVAATFHRFHWSSCSRKEFHRRAKHFKCLDDKPSDDNKTSLSRQTPKETFTMDEQCRMEFGEGYALCRSFELPGPCSHLWCGHPNVSQVCKTKKGPPLEGTACGENKWCINGYCEFMDRKQVGSIKENSRDGGWSSWTPWGKCSRSCGVGVRFRFRQCNEPTPALGGKYCEGNGKDFTTCAQSNCSVNVDLRQQQCLRFPVLIGIDEKSPRYTMNWLPHEPDQEHLKCRVSCRSAETNEIFISQESLIDGTPCSYGATDICVQGTCRRMGCDKIPNSGMKIDSCGVCNGNDSTCSRLVNKFHRKIRRGMTRVSIIPRGSYDVSVNVTIASKTYLARDNLTFTIRDGRRRRNDLGEFDSSGRAQSLIVEGAVFRSRRSGNDYEISARGPVHAEASVKSGITISGASRYIVNRNDTSKRTKFSWISGGWSPCSVSCGGGTSHKTIACRDDETGRIVNRKRCSLLSKPIKQTEKCNNFSCQFKWISGPWEGCTTTCGNHGIQHRQIYCVHSSFADNNVTDNNEVTVYRIMESPIRCKGSRQPDTKRNCNRTPCAGNSIFSVWSSCSRSCGKPIQTRLARCVDSREDNDNHECHDSTRSERESLACKEQRNAGCDYYCQRDKTKYCIIMTLKRYCSKPGFRRRCCRSCNDKSWI